MPLLLNFVAAADTLEKSRQYESYLKATFNVVMKPDEFNLEATVLATFKFFEKNLLNNEGGEFFKIMDLLEAYAWVHQNGSQAMRWLPGTGEANGVLFSEYLDQHHRAEEEEEEENNEETPELPKLHAAVDLVIKLERHWLTEGNTHARQRIPEFFGLLRYCEELYDMMLMQF